MTEPRNQPPIVHVLLVVSVCVLPSCQSRRPIVLTNWLTCGECTDGQLDALKRLEPVPYAELTEALLTGPPAATMSQFEDRLTQHHQTLTEEAEPDHRLRSQESLYVARYSGNLRRLYRLRAAEGLSHIGGAEAKEALELGYCAEKTREGREQLVLDVIESALGRLGAKSPEKCL